MLIGVPLETAPGETRVSVTPETVKKLKAQGHTLKIQSGAGVAASVWMSMRWSMALTLALTQRCPCKAQYTRPTTKGSSSSQATVVRISV